MINLPAIPAIDTSAQEAALNRQKQLTKPEGSLGKLEALSVKIAGCTANPRPDVSKKMVIVMAADHGVTAEGVSAYPAEVTPQMVMNFIQNGAAINVLARQAGAEVRIVDIGVNYDFGNVPGLIDKKVKNGTDNMAAGPAMSRAEAEQALLIGIEITQQEIKKGCQLMATGEMGIGNTTAAAAIAAVYTQISPVQLVGRGTGLDDAGLARKAAIVKKAIEVNQPDPADPIDVLAKVGGLEIAGLAGVILGSAAKRVPVMVDGFISTAAAIIAHHINPDVDAYMISGHRSAEYGHRAMLDYLSLEPLLNLDLRLGEGTGAMLAFNLVEAACKTLNEMATFADAQVSEAL